MLYPRAVMAASMSASLWNCSMAVPQDARGFVGKFNLFNTQDLELQNFDLDFD